jgi:amino acid adenylation domain-containing protein
MLSREQRAELLARLRRGQEPGAAGRLGRRSPGLGAPTASFGQEQLWFLDQFAPGQATYNVPSVLRIAGPLDPGALERALDQLVMRHEVLRSRLVADGLGRPVQVVDPVVPAVLEVADLAGPGLAGLREFVVAEAMRPFDLAAGPLLRACLVRLGEAEHALVAVFHHAVFDGWSAGVLVRDLAALYRGEVTGEEPGLGELPVQFADYAVWERERLRGEFLAGLESYWRRVLDGFETVQFPADRPRPVVDCFDGALAGRMTDAGLLAGLREVSRREGVTLFVTLMAGLLTLLHRYTGQDDLVVGTVSANRGRAELAPLIGFLVNTLPIRCDLSGDPAFRDLLARVKEVVVGAFAHQDLPFGQLVDALEVERDASRSPVFQINFTYAERDDQLVHAAGASFGVIDVVRGIDAAKFDLTFAVEARAGGLWLECCYKTALFDAGTIERLLGHLEVLLRGVVSDPSARLSRLPLLTEAELRRELVDWNDTAGPVPPVCVHEGFQVRAVRTPDAVAAEYEGERVSYAELNRQANQAARRLRELGVGPEALVGVSMRTGLRRLAALLGILKAGAGYVPLDPALPPERLAFMINDTGMRVVLTDHASAGRVPVGGALNVDAEWDQLSRLADDDLIDTGVTPANVAYVIYTSGSTGQPKGVVVEHGNLVNLAYGLIGHWGIGPGSVMLQFASFAFDVSVKDMFLSLLSGARLVLAAPETLHSPPRLAALIRQTGVTFASLPPAVLGLLPAGQYPELRVIMAGGEELPAEVARRWIGPGLRLVNGYGPTETTVTAAFAELDDTTAMPPPIGFPVRPNYRAYVLDERLNPVPVGVLGELHIGGAGVARGYLNRPELTRERFIADPFVPGERLYKSGDLVRRRLDGSLEFAGRIDSQVKIRGIRMELGEIETALATHPGVAQAVVTVVTGPAGDSELAAYLRPDPGLTNTSSAASGRQAAGRTAPVSDQDLHAHLARTLPPAMIPSHYITVEGFPLNSSGKVDRKALPTPRRQLAEDRAEPETPTEAMLISLYAAVLGTTIIGATDSFFDLGGNSLTAMRLVTMISRETEVDVGVSSVFLHPTPRRLAAAISRSVPLAGSGPLVTLSSGKAESPLFLVHAIGGTVSAYASLGQELADTFTVYGLESPALSDGGVVASSLADLVADYAQRILAVQPAGPYALAGWSMGGVIAFEIAQRLEQAGAEVGLLVLLDAPFAIPSGYPSGEAELAARFVADAAHSLGLDTAGAPDPAAVTPAGQLAWLAGRLAGGSDPAERDAAQARLQRRFGLFAAHSRMLAGYRPGGSSVRAATLIVSAAGSLNAPARALWPGQLNGEVSVLSVESDHYEFLRPPLVHDVGAAVARLAQAVAI